MYFTYKCVFFLIYLLGGSDEPTVDGEKPASLIEETINVLEESRNSEFEIIDDRKRSRWNKSRPNLWKKNKTKQLRSMCQDYPSRINKEDKILKAKKPKSVNCENCKYKCVEKFTDDERQFYYVKCIGVLVSIDKKILFSVVWMQIKPRSVLTVFLKQPDQGH